MNILKAVDLQKIYGQGETEVRALDGVNLEVEKGEFVAIVGTCHCFNGKIDEHMTGCVCPTFIFKREPCTIQKNYIK